MNIRCQRTEKAFENIYLFKNIVYSTLNCHKFIEFPILLPKEKAFRTVHWQFSLENLITKNE